MSKALLEIQNLHVRVEEKEILHGVDLTVGQDETHVLMGPNGTGKSTLGYAITGNPTYSVTGGSIIFNGENITELPVNERAKKGIFLSFQNPLEVPGVTLSAFIRSALEQKTGDRLRLWDFKKRLKETMRLLSMDESYAERDLNVGFSGGEKKKIAIARALYKDAPFIILDEPTAALDPIAEAEIYSKFDEIAGDKTAIYISHRLSSCKFCDEIAVFHEGAVIQQGSHAELLADRGGKYYALWNAQAQYYTE